MEKIKQDRVMTSIVGSYPKPQYVRRYDGRKLLDECGKTFYETEKEIGKQEFDNLLDKATLTAIEDQNDAGIDFISDGEQRRCHYVLYVLRKMRGFDFEKLKKRSIRNNVLVRELPVVNDKISYNGPILVNDFKFIEKFARNIPKITLPGPSTVLDCVVDDYYKGNMEEAAMDYAESIRNEIKNLINAGCRAIQFDDPVLLRNPDQAEDWGLKTLQSCFEGLEDQAFYFVHICRGYPDKPLERKGIAYKAKSDYYRYVLEWLSESEFNVVSIEGTQSNLDLSILPAIGKKTVMLGVLDVGSNEVENVDSIVARGREALKYLPGEQLILGPDCGMLLLSQDSAKAKLSNIATAASILNS